MASADDLLAFEADNRIRPGKSCTVCSLPERDVIDEAKRQSQPGAMGGQTVRRWLIAQCGYTIDSAPSKSMIDHHFFEDHHRRAQ